MVCSCIGCVAAECMLVVDPRDIWRFLPFVDIAVVDRERLFRLTRLTRLSGCGWCCCGCAISGNED